MSQNIITYKGSTKICNKKEITEYLERENEEYIELYNICQVIKQKPKPQQLNS